MAKKSKAKGNSISLGLITPSPDGFVKDCKICLGKVLGLPGLSFEQNHYAGNKVVWMLRGPSKYFSLAEARYAYTVVPFLTSKKGYFWLTVELEFAREKLAFYLTSTTIIVFEGLSTDNKKRPLFRAEWACISENPPPPHAQPHWHVYTNTREKTEPEFIVDVPPAVFQPQQEEVVDANVKDDNQHLPEWEQGEKFHFAMASHWHIDGENAHQEIMEHEKLIKWIEGCIKYTYGQMKYIYGEVS